MYEFSGQPINRFLLIFYGLLLRCYHCVELFPIRVSITFLSHNEPISINPIKTIYDFNDNVVAWFVSAFRYASDSLITYIYFFCKGTDRMTFFLNDIAYPIVNGFLFHKPCFKL